MGQCASRHHFIPIEPFILTVLTVLTIQAYRWEILFKAMDTG